MKTTELIGPYLDFAVAKCVGRGYPYPASTDWSIGGPIIEKIGGFELKVWLESSADTRCEVHIHNYEGNWTEFGPTPLIAAMRCFVASKLGDEVDIQRDL